MSTKMSDIDNAQLEEVMGRYSKEPNRPNLMQLVMAIKDTQLFVPATPREEGKAQKGFVPFVVKNQQGELYMPAFTSQAKFPTDKRYPGMLRIAYKECEKLLLDSPTKVQGIALNPFSDNLLLKTQMLELTRKVDRQELPPHRSMQIKAGDFHMISRHTVEFHLIPDRLFKEKMDFAEKLDEELLYELYMQPYKDLRQEKKYPYKKSDFECMELHISDAVHLIQIIPPKNMLVKTTSRELYPVWNPKTERFSYYLVEKGSESDEYDYYLDIVRPDGTWEKLEEAPTEGSVISRVVELFEAQADSGAP